jgi:hypothetical protein
MLRSIIAAQLRWAMGLLACLPLGAFGQLQIIPNSHPLLTFPGSARNLRVEFHNPTDNPIETKLSTRLYQVSAATIMPVGEAQPLKSLTVLPKQTVIETITRDFPSVRGVTRFELRWSDEMQKVIGGTEVIVYPDNLLNKLTKLAGEKPVGLLDPNKQIGPALARQKVEFQTLENSAGVEEFTGHLLIVGPFSSASQVTQEFPELRKRVAAKAKGSAAFVWFQPPSKTLEPTPPAYLSRVGMGAVIIAPDSAVANFAESPAAQLNLLRYAEFALQREALPLPQTEP